MPHGWRFAARSAGWPTGCAASTAFDRRRGDITGAFVDRARIDWTALVDRASDSHQRAILDSLRRLDRLRGAARRDPPPEPSHAWTAVVLLATGAAALQSLLGLALYAATVARGSGGELAPSALIVIVFAAASLLLASAVYRDHRVAYLLAAFMLSAGAFARVLLEARSNPAPIASSALLRGVYPEAFVPAALWLFATVFPSVHRFTTFDVFARRAAWTAGALGATLFLINLLLMHGALPASFSLLSREHPRNLFWQLYAAVALPALAVIVIRAWRASPPERIKVVRFACAIAAGSMPLLVVGVAESQRDVNAWLVATGLRPWANATAMAALAAMPILVTLAVLVDGTFERRRVARLPRAGRMARAVDHLDTIRATLLRRGRYRERLAAALDQVRLARDSREIGAVLERALRDGAGATSVRIVSVDALPAGTALLTLFSHTPGTIDLSRSGDLFMLLPREDRAWLEASRVALAAAVRLRDGTMPAVILLGYPPGRDAFSRAERWFIATLVTGASAAWDAGEPADIDDRCADECPQCGRVRAAGDAPCCDAKARLAALPKRLGSRFVVIRRLGAGGMGVVYLGHDCTLDRDVALKTWTGMREDMITRLRDEARVMATLNHEALATIYGLERWRRTPVLVMELCARGTLADAIARGRLDVAEVLRLAIRLTGGLAYMHDRGFLHRDIKPSNIGFTADGAAKLLDFGLAGADDHPGGTPAYLPPESFRGAPSGAAVDLWSLAMVLHEACGGADADPGPLDAFFARALAADPDDRYQSIVEMRAALERLRIGMTQ